MCPCTYLIGCKQSIQAFLKTKVNTNGSKICFICWIIFLMYGCNIGISFKALGNFPLIKAWFIQIISSSKEKTLIAFISSVVAYLNKKLSLTMYCSLIFTTLGSFRNLRTMFYQNHPVLRRPFHKKIHINPW